MLDPLKSLKVRCAETGISLSQACRLAGVDRHAIESWNRKIPKSFQTYNAILEAIEKYKALERKNEEEGC